MKNKDGVQECPSWTIRKGWPTFGYEDERRRARRAQWDLSEILCVGSEFHSLVIAFVKRSPNMIAN